MIRAYLRVSTTEQSQHGHGLDAQRAAIRAEGLHRGWGRIAWYVDAGSSGKDLHRPAMRQLLDDVKRNDVVVVAKLDRLSRSLADFAGLMAESQRKRWGFVALDLAVDTTTPTGRLVANVMASVAEWEREVIGQRTKDGLAAAKVKGILPGRRSALPPQTRARIVALRAEGLSFRAVAEALNAEQVRTVTGRSWSPAGVHGALTSVMREQAAATARSAEITRRTDVSTR